MNILGDFSLFVPETAVLVAAVVMLILDLTSLRARSFWGTSIVLALVPLFLLAACPCMHWTQEYIFGNAMVGSDVGFVFSLIIYLSLLFTVLISAPSIYPDLQGSYYALLFSASFGALILVRSADLITLIIAFELLSISMFLLIGYHGKSEPMGREGLLKFFLVSAFASAFLIFGIAFIWGSGSGSTLLADFTFFNYPIDAGHYGTVLLFIGMALAMVGVGFKMGAAPFHFWIPDVYQGAPHPVTAFLMSASKAAGFAVFILLIHGYFPWLIAFMAILTLLIGNFVAIAQRDLKRLLAYSSIGQAGYIVLALVAVGPDVTQAAVFYLVGYSLMVFLVFGAYVAIAHYLGRPPSLDDLAGLAKGSPFVAYALGLGIFAMAGIPPTVGFTGKLLIFKALVDRHLYSLALGGLLITVVAAYFYLKVIMRSFMADSQSAAFIKLPVALGLVIVLSMAGIFALGLFPSLILNLMPTLAIV